jgi:hypothetical protein
MRRPLRRTRLNHDMAFTSAHTRHDEMRRCHQQIRILTKRARLQDDGHPVARPTFALRGRTNHPKNTSRLITKAIVAAHKHITPMTGRHQKQHLLSPYTDPQSHLFSQRT